MKRFALAAAALLLAVTSLTAKDYKRPSFKEELVCKMGEITPKDVKIKGSTQGFAAWGRYGFVFHDGGQCVVVDLEKRDFLTTFFLEDNRSHCNNASFGVEKARGKESAFPLLYISECKGEHRCYVTDIATHGGKTVQTIYYSGEGYTGSYDWFVDRKHKHIYTYGTCGKDKLFKKFRLPKLKDSDMRGEVHLTEADVLDQFTIGGIGIYQGSKTDGRYAYLGEGYPPHDRNLHVVDLKKKKKVATVNVNHLHHEPEGLDIRDGWLYVAMHVSRQPRNELLYRFSLK